MAVVALPSGLAVQQQDFGIRRYDLSFANGDSGAAQARILAPPRWICTLVGADRMELEQAAQWRAVILSLDGQVNQLAVHDLLNEEPAGTARGNWTCNGGAAAGATSMAISAGLAQAGKTILLGDWIGVGQASSGPARQLLHVQANVTLDANGDGTVTFKAPLRVAVGAGDPIAWDKPTCLMKVLAGVDSTWVSRRARQSGFALDLVESWE